MITIEKWSTRFGALAQGFIVSTNRCQNPDHFSQYLQWCATPDMQQGRSFTYVAVEYKDDGTPLAIAGFVSARANAFVDNDRRCGDPAIEITELAVAAPYTRQGIGLALTGKILELGVKLAREYIGVRFAVLRATNEARGFYENKALGFRSADETFEAVPGLEGNQGCVPMYLRLAVEEITPQCSSEDEEA